MKLFSVQKPGSFQVLAVPLIGGFPVEAHSHIENYISELGAVGTQWVR